MPRQRKRKAGVVQRYSLTIVVLLPSILQYSPLSWPPPTSRWGTHWWAALGVAVLLGLESFQKLQSFSD